MSAIGAYSSGLGTRNDIGPYIVPLYIWNTIGAYILNSDSGAGASSIGAYEAAPKINQILDESVSFDISVIDTKQNTVNSYKNITYLQSLDLPEISQTLDTNKTIIIQINTQESAENTKDTNEQVTLAQDINLQETLQTNFNTEALIDLLSSFDSRQSTFIISLSDYRKLQVFAENRIMHVKKKG